MKKKILALFLVFTFVCAIGVGSFANTGDGKSFRLTKGQTITLRVYSKDMDKQDDDLTYSIIFESNKYSSAKLEVIDKKTKEVVATRYPRVRSSFVRIKNFIDPTRDYYVKLTNTGDMLIEGSLAIFVN